MQPYAAVPLGKPATLSGTVALSDSTHAGAPMTTVGNCPVSAPKEPSVSPEPSVVIWVDGVTSGKAFPQDNRYDLVSSGCELEPRVQAVRTGGAINVINDDRAIHRLVFIRLGSHDTLQVMPFANSGEIVATDRLTKTAGIIEVRCLDHPWTRGYIAVFDHPYFAVAARGGTFSIDSLPPGEHTLMSWHEGQLKPTVQTVSVGPTGAKVFIP